MELGKVIRTFRKEKQLTQEEMARRLGVTPPAVNKWENGNSYPDITLLAPIARLLGITTDTLLSYRKELTDQEIQEILTRVGARMKKEEYSEVFQWAMGVIQEYPGCEALILPVAQVLDAYRDILQVPEAEKYDEEICSLYRRMLNSTDSAAVYTALTALFLIALKKEQYELAEQYLDKIPQQRVDPMRYRALLYAKQEKNDLAYELYERMLFQGYSDLTWCLQGISALAIKENHMDKAERIAQKQKKLAEILEMGKYMEASPEFSLAYMRKDKEACLYLLEEMTDGLGDMAPYRKSDLYSHLQYAKRGSENTAFMMLKALEEDENLDFLRGEERFERILENLRVVFF